MAVIVDLTNRWLRKKSECEVYAVGGAFRSLAIPDGSDIAKVPWTIDCVDYVVTASHPMQAIEQVFEHHATYAGGWVFNDRGQRVVFVCPMADLRTFNPGAAEPQEAKWGAMHVHVIGY